MYKLIKAVISAAVLSGTLAGCANVQPTRFRVVDAVDGSPISDCPVNYWVKSGSIFGRDDLRPGEGYVGRSDRDGYVAVPPLPRHDQYEFGFGREDYWGGRALWDYGGSEVDVASPDAEEIARAGKVMPRDWVQKDGTYSVRDVIVVRLRSKQGVEQLQDVSEYLKQHPGG